MGWGAATPAKKSEQAEPFLPPALKEPPTPTEPPPAGASVHTVHAITLAVLGAIIAFLFALLVDYAEAVEHGGGAAQLVYDLPPVVIFVLGLGLALHESDPLSWRNLFAHVSRSALISLETALIMGALLSWPDAQTLGVRFIQLDSRLLIRGLRGSISAAVAAGATAHTLGPERLALLSFVLCPLHVLNDAFWVGGDALGGDALLEGGVGPSVLDPCGALTVHAFGAFFGLAASWSARIYAPAAAAQPATGANAERGHGPAGASQAGVATCGAALLWLAWPSFHAASFDASAAAERSVAMANTLLALIGSAFSALVAAELQLGVGGGGAHAAAAARACVAGGVAVASVAGLNITPGGALGVGIAAGVLAHVGTMRVVPWLRSELGIDDALGVCATFGLPGVLGAVLAALAQGVRAGWRAAGWQLFALLATGATALLGGLMTGWLVSNLELVEEPPDAAEREDGAAADGAAEGEPSEAASGQPGAPGTGGGAPPSDPAAGALSVAKMRLRWQTQPPLSADGSGKRKSEPSRAAIRQAKAEAAAAAEETRPQSAVAAMRSKFGGGSRPSSTTPPPADSRPPLRRAGSDAGAAGSAEPDEAG